MIAFEMKIDTHRVCTIARNIEVHKLGNESDQRSIPKISSLSYTNIIV